MTGGNRVFHPGDSKGGMLWSSFGFFPTRRERTDRRAGVPGKKIVELSDKNEKFTVMSLYL
jgi:hypothetical protein